MLKKILTPPFLIGIALIGISSTSFAYDGNANGVTFGVSYINRWPESKCANGRSLHWTDNQMKMLDSTLRKFGLYSKMDKESYSPTPREPTKKPEADFG